MVGGRRSYAVTVMARDDASPSAEKRCIAHRASSHWIGRSARFGNGGDDRPQGRSSTQVITDDTAGIVAVASSQRVSHR